MAGLLIVPYAIPIYESPGVPAVGATLTIYNTGTSTLANIYADAALSIPLTNPQVSDLNGRFFEQSTTIWANNALAYDCALLTPSGESFVESGVPTVSLPIDTSGFLQNPNVVLTGVPTAPTPAADDNSSKIATTAYVTNALGEFNVLNASVIPQSVTGCVGINTSTATQNSTWTYTSAVLPSVNAGVNPTTISNFTGTLYLTGSVGSNGLDAGGLVANTVYFVHTISDGAGNNAVLASTSYNNPTMPATYTYKALIGLVRTDASKNTMAFTFSNGNFDFIQPSLIKVASGSTSGSWTNISLSNWLPPAGLAVRARFSIWNNNNTVGAAAAPINPTTYGTGYSWVEGGSNGGNDYFALSADFPLVTQSVWWASTGGSNYIALTGFSIGNLAN